jgi:cyclopropane fatty-acyl-phospholipid synthase-like methyltransferase
VFWLAYLRGHTPWDTNVTPPELVETVTGPDALAPGRALDLGCGTGTNVIFLAQHGWDAVGIDFVDHAIRRAKRKAVRAGVSAQFFAADVTRLENIPGLEGSFDLVVDIGCFHSLSPEGQKAYASGLKRRLRPEGTFLLYTWLTHPQGTGIVQENADPTVQLFAPDLRVQASQHGQERGRPTAWYWFRRQHGQN